MQLRNYVEKFENLASYLQTPLLFVLRFYWGFSFARTGWGKLMNLDRTVNFFTDLGIPAPKLNAIMAGSTECFGGALLLVGLFSRVVSVPLAGTMVVAYLTADRDALMAIFSDTDKFVSAAPFQFLLTAVIVLAFGPGKLSLDHLLAKRKTAN
ncbi:MAG: DoxX family protein [Opitutae bacterium]|nr:DoxX family protein [Opitutae bacterium]